MASLRTFSRIQGRSPSGATTSTAHFSPASRACFSRNAAEVWPAEAAAWPPPTPQGDGWLLALGVRLEEPDPLPQGLTHDANFVPAGFQFLRGEGHVLGPA